MPESSKPTPLPSFLNTLPKIATELFVNDQDGIDERYRVPAPRLRVGDFSGAIAEDVDLPIGRGVKFGQPPRGKARAGMFAGTEYVLRRSGIDRIATEIDKGELRTYEVSTYPRPGSGKEFLALFGKIRARLGTPSLIATNERPNRTIKWSDWERTMPKEWQNAYTRPIALQHVVPGFNTRAYAWVWGTGSVDLPASIMRSDEGPMTVLYLTFTSSTTLLDARGKLISHEPNRIGFGIDTFGPFER